MVQSNGEFKPVPDRRSGKDRRKTETPVKGRERRRHIEPRRPVVTEIELSLTEWDDLQQSLDPLPPGPVPKSSR